ncbi:MAG: RNA-binding protein [Microscillaceae bacterium]|nr:RNA-binding protein [Microscillaceae bacterium]
MNIFVSNLPFNMSDAQLEEVFADFGDVDSAKIIKDKVTGKSRGFGFVEMPDDEEANQAIQSLDNAEVSGRVLKVKKAHPRQ